MPIAPTNLVALRSPRQRSSTPSAPTPAHEDAPAAPRARRKGGRRTLPLRLLKKAIDAERLDPGALVQLERDRPRTRSACKGGLRPCPFVSCRYHLFLDVNHDNGSIRFNFPGASVADLEHSCALDVAEDGGLTLERIGELLGMTRERIRQLERDGLEVLLEALER